MPIDKINWVECYRAIYRPIYRRDGQCFERQFDVKFVAANQEAAMEDGLRWMIRNFGQLCEPYGLLYVGSCKVCLERIGPIREDGRADNNWGPFLAWKCDTGLYYPNSPSDALSALIEQLKALRHVPPTMIQYVTPDEITRLADHAKTKE